MTAVRFNPFEDRLSRDIRNDLSESIIEVLTDRAIEPAETIATGYLKTNLPQIYTDYIDQRLSRYTAALTKLSEKSNLLSQAAVLWDLKLFFEVHEILEPQWMTADGDQKRLLQALIRAAGVYINLELNYLPRAEKIAAKALPVLRELQDELARELKVANLIEALETLSMPPPQLSLP